MFMRQGSLLLSLTLAALNLLPGCSGSVFEGANDAGVQGGNQGVGGKAATGGSAAATGGAMICCNAMPVCGATEQQVASQADCPTGVECSSRTICCTTIWCAKVSVQCTAIPVCDSGDTQVQGTCPPSASCYERTTCGSTILCKYADGKCDPSVEFNRNYVATDPKQCMVIDYICPSQTSMFSNDCGCGCEQDSTCPRYVDCMPGPSVSNPLCAADGRCPYTIRAL